MTKREFDQLRTDILAQFTAMRGEIQAMLPREIFDVRVKQMVDDIADLQSRQAKLETTNVDLNTKLLSVQQVTAQTPQQINSSAEKLRADAMAKAVEMGIRIVFGIGMSFLTFVAYYLGTHVH